MAIKQKFCYEVASPKDYGLIAKFLVKQRQELVERYHLNPQKAASWIQAGSSAEFITQVLGYPPAVLYIVREVNSSSIIASAFVNTRPVNEPPELFGLYIDKNFQGQGIGRHLLKMRLNFLIRKGARHARMWVLQNNTIIQSLAQSEGFTQTTRKYEDSAPGWRFIELVKELDRVK